MIGGGVRLVVNISDDFLTGFFISHNANKDLHIGPGNELGRQSIKQILYLPALFPFLLYQQPGPAEDPST